MRVLVFEQWLGGHYFNYLEHLVPRLAAISDRVVVAVTSEATASEQFNQQLGHLRELRNVEIDDQVPIPPDGGAAWYRWRLGRNLVEAIRRHKPDRVVLPSADEQLVVLPLHQLLSGAGRGIRRIPIDAVIHYKAYTARAGARERLVSAAQRTLAATGTFSRLNFVNFLQYEDACADGLGLARIARVAGDPVPQPLRLDRAAARRALGLEVHGRYVGMIGGLDHRKAVPATVAAFKRMKRSRADRLLLAGRLAPDYAALLRDEYRDLVRDGSIVVMDRMLSSEELAQGFAAIDVHSSVYDRFSGLSSLMLKSLAAGVPVIVGDQPGWGRAVVKRFDVGTLVPPTDIERFAIGLRSALDDAPDYSERASTGRLLAFHSVSNFADGLLEHASLLAGRPASQAPLSWDWVLQSLPPEKRGLR